jgi:hypothetical protein
MTSRGAHADAHVTSGAPPGMHTVSPEEQAQRRAMIQASSGGAPYSSDRSGDPHSALGASNFNTHSSTPPAASSTSSASLPSHTSSTVYRSPAIKALAPLPQAAAASNTSSGAAAASAEGSAGDAPPSMNLTDGSEATPASTEHKLHQTWKFW